MVIMISLNVSHLPNVNKCIICLFSFCMHSVGLYRKETVCLSLTRYVRCKATRLAFIQCACQCTHTRLHASGGTFLVCTCNVVGSGVESNSSSVNWPPFTFFSEKLAQSWKWNDGTILKKNWLVCGGSMSKILNPSTPVTLRCGDNQFMHIQAF